MGIHWITLPIHPPQTNPKNQKKPKKQKHPRKPKKPKKQKKPKNKKKQKNPTCSLEIIANPEENQDFHWKSLQNLRKTKIFIGNHCKTKGKPNFSLEITANPKEKQCFGGGGAPIH